jgi:hypothetical protein
MHGCLVLAAWCSAFFVFLRRAVWQLWLSGLLLSACSLHDERVETELRGASLGQPEANEVSSSSLTLIAAPKPVSQYELAGCLGYAVTNTLLGSKLVTMDLRNESSTALGTAYLTYNLTGLAADPRTRKLYAVDATSLYQVDPETAQVSRIGLVNLLLGPLKGLEFGHDGQLYSFAALGGLTRIDTATGKGTKVFNSLLPSLLAMDAFAFSADGSRIYVALLDRLYTINPASGEATLLPGRLPVRVSAMHAREDGRLILVPKQAVSFGYELVLFDPASSVWKTVTTYPVIPKDQLACGGFNAFTWPRACGSITSGGRAPLIKNVALSQTSVCVGDTVSVTVTALHPERAGEPAQVTVNALPGHQHKVQLTTAGDNPIDVNAQTADGYVDSRTVRVEAHSCSQALRPPTLRITNNVFVQDGADLTILNTQDYSASASYAWAFGDGQTLNGSAPHAQHSYALSLNADKRFQVFEVSVTVTDGGRTASTTKTLALWNSYVIDRDDHRTLRPPMFAAREFEEESGSLTVDYGLVNLESHPLQITRKYLEYLPCNEADGAQITPMQGVSITVPSQSFYAGTERMALASLPPNACKVGLHLRGVDGDKVIQVDSYLRVPSRTGWRRVTSPAMLTLTKRIRDNLWVPEDQNIRGVDLRRLVLEGRIGKAELDAAYADMGALPQVAGDTCRPGAVHPTNPNMTCQRTEQMETTRQWEIVNARKGDLLLVAGCGIVAAAIRQVQPQQFYTHEGIMTKNRVELAEVTVFEDRFAEEEYLDGLVGARGTKREVLKFGEPGALKASVHRAFNGIQASDGDGHDYILNDYAIEPRQCAGDVASIRAKVVKPPIETDGLVRSKLIAAADKALELIDERPHYRLFAFSEGSLPWLESYKHEGRPAAISSVFLWWALKRAEWDNGIDIPLEGCSLDRSGSLPRWKCSPGDIEPGEFRRTGAEVDSQSWDGVYLYRGDERRQGLEAIRTYVKRGTYEEYGWLAKFSGADAAFSSRVVNCFGYDLCAESEPCSECESPSCCTPQELQQNPANTPPPRCIEACNQYDDLIFRGATEGRTSSPDDFLKWDKPAGSLLALENENGVYGSSEYLDIDDIEMRDVYEWKLSDGFGAVSGHVIFEEGACESDGDCAMGSCVSGMCQWPADAVQVEVIGGDNDTAVTDAAGFFEFSAARAGIYELNAYVQRDFGDGIHPYAGTRPIFVPNQGSAADQDIVLRRQADPKERELTLSGSIELIDCDCATRNETKTHNFSVSCRVTPSVPVASLDKKRSELCNDETGVELDGECVLNTSDNSVRVSLWAGLYEGRTYSCGGDELEASTSMTFDVPADATTPFDVGRLLHKDWCVYAVIPVRCDDKAFFSKMKLVNRIAPF